MKAAGKKVAAIAGDLLDAETMYAAKKLLEGQGSACSKAARPASIMTSPASPRCGSTRRSPIWKTPTRSCWSASNPRWEAPLVNTRLRKAAKRGAKVFAIGPEVDLTYNVAWLGDDLTLLGKLPRAPTLLPGRRGR